jgi:hypothetical protein
MNEIAVIQVPFHGDTIEAIQNERGVWAPLKRMCENLGLDACSQARKLADKPWAVTVIMTVTGPDGKQYKMLCLHIKSLAMWLATIEASRVKEDLKTKLALYQTDCADVLSNHFLGTPAPAVQPAAPPAAVEALLAAVQALVAQQSQLAAQQGQLTELVTQRLGAVETSLALSQQHQVGPNGHQNGHQNGLAVNGHQNGHQNGLAALNIVGLPSVPAPPLTLRMRLRALVNDYVNDTDVPHQNVYGQLYRQLYYRCNYSARQRAAELNALSKLDAVEKDGLLPQFFAIAVELLRPCAVQVG